MGMDDESRKFFEDVIDNQTAPELLKFKAELLLLFDRYDPHRPESQISPEEFYGTLFSEMLDMSFRFNSAVDMVERKVEEALKKHSNVDREDVL